MRTRDQGDKGGYKREGGTNKREERGETRGERREKGEGEEGT